MHFETTWHADGLRWIVSLFTAAADSLERTAARPSERSHAALMPADHLPEDVRARIHSRYL